MDKWTESEHREKRGAAAMGLFNLEDPMGQKLEKKQRYLVEVREILDKPVHKDYLKVVPTRSSATYKPEKMEKAKRFKEYEKAIIKSFEIEEAVFCFLCEEVIKKHHAYLSFPKRTKKKIYLHVTTFLPTWFIIFATIKDSKKGKLC